jgi:hypothetical protein
MAIFGIPLQAQPQTFTITLSGVVYTLTAQYRPGVGWVLDIEDNQGNAIVQGIPLVTGANLLAQYAYLGFVGGLWVQTLTDPDAVPTFENLGSDGLLYYVT